MIKSINFYFFIVIISLSTFQNYFAQVKLSLGGGLGIHLKSSDDKNNVYYSNVQLYNQDHPTIGLFFDNSAFYNLAISYRFIGISQFYYLVDFEFSRTRLSNSYSNSEFLLGENLNIYSYSPKVGLGSFTDDNQNFFCYGLIGIAIKEYEGNFNAEPLNVIELYKTGTFFNLTLGVEIEKFTDIPVSLGFVTTVEFGAVDRGNILVYSNNELVAHAHPTGDISLSDNNVGLLFQISYLIDF